MTTTESSQRRRPRRRRRTRTTKKKRRLYVERPVIVLLLLLAWFWIAATVLVVWHSTTTTSSRTDTPTHIRQVDTQQRHEPQSQQPTNTSPLLIFTCSRAEYLSKTLTDVFSHLPQDCSVGCPVIISQDGRDQNVVRVIHDFQRQHSNIIHWQHSPAVLRRGKLNPYQALAVHYGWALGRIFQELNTAQRVIILEEDIHTSVDFFDYMKKLAPVLEEDETLFAVSAFNDNGVEGKIKDATRVVRSDFFPGLGWMLTRRLWETELASKWPNGYWDDWLREPVQRKGRQVLRPEISRTFHFGREGGASKNQFGSVLGSVHLNNVSVDWSSVEVTHLAHPEEYDKHYMEMVQSAALVDTIQDALEWSKTENVRLEYPVWGTYQFFANMLGLMEDEKAGIPRTAYKGIVETRPHGEYLLFLTPKFEWKGKMPGL